MSDVNAVMICAEFITSLSVANFYIGFDKEPHPCKPQIREIICGRREINVKLVYRRCQDVNDVRSSNGVPPAHNNSGPKKSATKPYSITLPSNLHLLPNTCSGLSHTPYGWLLRLNFQLETDNGILSKKTVDNVRAPNVYRFVCRACDNRLLRSDADICNRINVSDLGLPPGMDWESLSLSYFCHDHSHGDEDDHESSDAPKQTSLAPQVNEVFDGESYYVVNAATIDFTAVDIPKGGDGLRCVRCHHDLGRLMDRSSNEREGAVKLLVDGVRHDGSEWKATDGGSELLFRSLLLECNKAGRKIVLYAKEDHLDDRLLLLWIMDKNLKVISTRFTESDKPVSPVDADLKSVCKVLYQFPVADSPVCKQWKTNPAVKYVQVSEQLIIKLTSALTESTEEMPKAWRYANGFLVGYLSSTF